MTTNKINWADDDDGWNQCTGEPGIGLFARAVQVWACFQQRPVSVKDAAKAFNCEAQRIIEAVEWHYWMFLAGPTDDHSKLMIEHEGE